MEINENFKNAKKEMIRADHLLYVSLKYSRTVDVIRSVISRLIDAFDFASVAVLESKFDGEELRQLMHGPKTRCDGVLKVFPNSNDHIEFYLYLRKLSKAPVVQSLNEFRKNVTFVTELDGKKIEIMIPTVEDYYYKMKKFVEYLNKELYGVEFEEEYRH